MNFGSHFAGIKIALQINTVSLASDMSQDFNQIPDIELKNESAKFVIRFMFSTNFNLYLILRNPL